MKVLSASVQDTRNDEQRSEVNVRLHGRWLVVGRVVWIVMALLGLTTFIIGLPFYFVHLQTACRSVAACSINGSLTPEAMQTLHQYGIAIDTYATGMLSVSIATALVWTAVGWVIFWRKSEEAMALFVALLLVTFGVSIGSGDTLAFVFPIWIVPVQLLRFIAGSSLYLFFYLFPNGRFVPRWTRWLALLALIDEMLSVVTPSGSPINSSWFAGLIGIIFLGSMLFAQLYRYRRVSNLVQRQQTKWVVFGITVTIVALLALFVPYLSFPTLSQARSGYALLISPGFLIVLLPIPASIGIAILRSRLWEIDIIINRTLVYGSLTALLALLYFGLILALQSLFQGMFHQNNAIAIVISTLVIAALFQPLRRRIQNIIDRRFYRRKYDAAKVVAAFSDTLRQEVDLDQLCERLVAVAHETMQPTHVSLWLPPTKHDGTQRAP